MSLGSGALIFGKSMLSPAISAPGVVERAEIVPPPLRSYMTLAALLILFALFARQRLSTYRNLAVFGLIMLVWVLAIVARSSAGILCTPRVLAARSSHHDILLLMDCSQAAALVQRHAACMICL